MSAEATLYVNGRMAWEPKLFQTVRDAWIEMPIQVKEEWGRYRSQCTFTYNYKNGALRYTTPNFLYKIYDLNYYTRSDDE